MGPVADPSDVTGDPYLSVVVPVYGAPESLRPLHARVRDVCATMGVTYELILVDDRCPKGSWLVVRQLAEEDSSVIGLRLSRNFGQHAAIQAGLSSVRGTWIVVMDCDLQDIPEEIPALLAKAGEGYDVVRGRRAVRADAWHRRAVSSAFYRLLGFLTGTEQIAEVANFGIYHRRVIDTVTSWDEELKYFPAIIQWVGFARTDLNVSHGQRHEGKSSYNYHSLINLAMSVIVGFSDRPLKLVMSAGLTVAFLSLVVSFAVVLLHFVGAVRVEGWTSIILSLWFIAGCLAFALGLTGLYVGRILVEAKGRPNFIVDQTMNGIKLGNRSGSEKTSSARTKSN
ncbi:hypothetical protein AXW83_22545 [Bosea sp. PAMC 26642]|nr:hypothetical protein AXW83_22545 [Bosea sp. PAMC 26642]